VVSFDGSNIAWDNDGFNIGQYRFKQNFGENIGIVQADYPEFIIMKDRVNIDDYLRVFSTNAGPWNRVLELGVMKGGSCVFFNELLKPQHHLAVDIYQHKMGLDGFANDVEASGRKFEAHFDVSQSDVSKICQLFEEMSGSTAEFDFIVDDASHSYDLSRQSFNGLFPKVRPGGIYAIEDWGWAHWGGRFSDPDHPEFNSPALSNLVVDTVLAATGASNAITRVLVCPNVAFVTRGPADLPSSFAVETSYPNRGKTRQMF
jgi:SAM-dependent methyltransferase